MTVKRIIAIMLAAVSALTAFAVPAAAVELDLQPVGAESELGVVAGEYEDESTRIEPDEDLPSAYSAVDLGYYYGPRTQRFNTCWAYCSTAVMEAQLNHSNEGVGYLSTMHMNYWATPTEDGFGWQRKYSDAGYSFIALGYITSFSGAKREEDFPDTANYEDYAALDAEAPLIAGATSLIYLECGENDAVKTAIKNYGGVAANFHYSSASMSDTYAYCYNVPGLATSQLYGHAITIVGWDDDYEVDNFTESMRPEHPGAWLVRNSWGASWGNNGYFWISYEDEYLFDKRFGKSYAITGHKVMRRRDKLQQNEIYGSSCPFNYINSENLTKMTYVNMLDFSDGHNTIDSVTFESVAEGAEYELFYIPADNNGAPSDDESTWTKLGEGTISYKGYHNVDIEDFTAPLTCGGIGVRIIRTPECSELSVGVGEWIRTKLKGYVLMPKSKRGESYIIGYDVEPVDLMDYYLNERQDEIGGTFVIKAMCRVDGMYGDLDDDNDVTIFDATIIQRQLARIESLDGRQMLLADYDNDGSVTVLDATKIQRVLAKLDPAPEEE